MRLSRNYGIGQFITYSYVGIIKTSADIFSYIMLSRLLLVSQDLYASKLISLFIGTSVGYVLNRKYTFSVSSKVTLIEILRYIFVFIVSMLCNLISFWMLVQTGLHDVISALFATMVSFIIGFTLTKSWVFRNNIY